MIDSRRGIIELREEREGGEAPRSSNGKQKREFNICKVTQADVTPVHTARASARTSHTHTHSHALTCWQPCWKPLTADSMRMKTLRFWPGCFEMCGVVGFYLSCQPEGHAGECVYAAAV